MPFAVSCRSCGARFSVAEDLYQKRFAGRIVTVRCKHCQAAIRLDASEPPNSPQQKLDRRPKWVPKPAPPPPRPAHVRAAAAAAAAAAANSLDTARVSPESPGDVFQTPPPSLAPPRATDELEPPVDLTEYARSEPPSSDTPALFELAHDASRQAAPETTEDVEFLLGLSGSPRTAAALVSPALPTFEDSPVEPEPGQDEPEEEATRAYARPQRDEQSPAREPSPSTEQALTAPVVPTPLERTASAPPLSSTPPPAKRRWPAVLVVVGVGAIGGTLGLFAHGFQVPQRAARSSGAETNRVQPEPAASLPRTDPAVTASADVSSAPATSEPAALEPKTAKLDPKPAAEPATPPAVAANPSSPSAASEVAQALVKPRSPEKTAIPIEKTETAPVSRPEAPVAQAPASPPSAAAPAPPIYEVSDAIATEPFNRAAAAAALSKAAEDASSCRKEGDPSGSASATVTFAPSGRVTTATLSGPPYAGTKTGGCIATSLRRARIPPFVGDKVTVGKTVVIR